MKQKNKYETEKSFSRHRHCHFCNLIALLAVDGGRYETLVVGEGSLRYVAIPCLNLTGFGIIGVYLHEK